MRTRLLATTMICGAAAAVGLPAMAQDAPVQEVVVTGSRIPQANMQSVSPIVTVGQQEIKLSGYTDTVDVLSNLPQANGSVGNAPNPLNGSGGFTTASLRNLGCARTLVLVDGHRLMPGDPTLGGECADLDVVPGALIDRTEIVTGGASAVYGSDAIAGVVNFIMKHNFTGVQVDAQYGISEHDNDNTAMQAREKKVGLPAPSGDVTDGATYTANITIGVNSADGKGNIEGYFGYRHQDPISEGNRDFSACLLSKASGGKCTGSATSNVISDLNSGIDYAVVGNQLIAYPISPLSTAATPATNASPTQNPPAQFNSSPYEYLTRQDVRYTGGFFAHYDYSPQIQFYATMNLLDDRSTEVIAPGGIFYGTAAPANPNSDFLVPCTSPLLSAQEVGVLCPNPTPAQFAAALAAGTPLANTPGAANATPGQSDILIGRRNIEGGGRISQYEHMSFRQVIGMRGDLGDVWHYDISGQYGYTKYTSRNLNYFSTNNVQAALNNGTYHLFTQGGVTAADLATVSTFGTSSGDTEEQIVSATIGGDLGHYGIKSPWAHDGIGVSVGTEYRREALDFLADANLGSGDLNGSSGAAGAVDSSFDVYELFGEVKIPLVQDYPFIKDLSVDYGYRFADYNTAGDVDAIKYAAEFAPTSDIRFRASYNRAVRAPNVNELFTPATVTQTSSPSADPCAGAAPTATLAACLNTVGPHFTAAQMTAAYGHITDCPANQCDASLGGNANLKPEISDTKSFGIIFTPTFFRGFDFSVDYYSIDVKGAISTIDPGVALNQCLTNGNLCGLVDRNSLGAIFGNLQLASGGYISSQNSNVGYNRTEGFDFSSHYRLNLSDIGLKGWGRMSASFDGTYLSKYIVSPAPGLGNYECAGYFGSKCGLLPNFRSITRLTWNTPWAVDASLGWRFIGGSSLDVNQHNPLLNPPKAGVYPVDLFDRGIGSINYFDLSLIWHVHDGYSLRAGVRNILDQDPPVVAQAIFGTGTPNTNVTYDTAGRTFFVGLTADF